MFQTTMFIKLLINNHYGGIGKRAVQYVVFLEAL